MPERDAGRISCLSCAPSVSRMSSPFDSVRNAKNCKRQFEEHSDDEHADEQRCNSRDESDETLSRRLLHTKYNASNDRDAARENRNNVEQLHDAAREQTLKGKVK